MTRTCLSIVLAIVSIPYKGICQNVGSIDSANTELMNAAHEIMNSAGTCALITLDDQGRPRARAMDPFPPDENFNIWFGTNPKSRKVNQIAQDPRVTIYYLDADESGYVMIHGTAQLVNDPDQKQRHWKQDWEAFYPDYPDGYLLIKVSPDWLEIVSEKQGILGDSITWQPPIHSFDKE